MIGHLRGILQTKNPESVVIDVQGVGYLVFIPFSTFYQLKEEGSEASLFIHTHVREDALSLFGFSTAVEKEIFQELISVSGIGPKLATTILSGMSAEDLIQAIADEDRQKLVMIPGLGKKTADRIILELKDKICKREFTEAAIDKPKAGITEDVISALRNLGYKKSDADKAVLRALKDVKDSDQFEDVLKMALKVLTG